MYIVYEALNMEEDVYYAYIHMYMCLEVTEMDLVDVV